MRPSCGSRFSAMLIDPVMIFRRLMIADLQFLRRILHLVQHAVDAEAHAETLLQRLEMNVARPHLVRLQQDHRHHLDDRRVAGLAPPPFPPAASRR